MSGAAAMKPVATFAGANQAKSVLHEWFATRGPNRAAFLQKSGWGDAVVTPLREDMGARHYFRLNRGTDTAVLMESVPDDHEYATPGQRLDDYVRITEMFRDHGVTTPAILAADIPEGYLMVEDFGDLSFRAAMLSGQVLRDDIYGTAMDVLLKLHSFKWPENLPRDTYYEGTMYLGLRRMVDWYVPVKRGVPNEAGLVDEFLNRWHAVEDALTEQVGEPIQGVAHSDFHLENLQWRMGQVGLARAGVLDFQDARPGPAVYDLTNLLNDARMSLEPEYKRALLEKFVATLPEGERENFRHWFWVYSGQFLHRVAGQFVKHATIGNTHYLRSFMPYIQTNLKDIMSVPALAPVNDLMLELGVDLEPFPADMDFSQLTHLIAPDAF